MEHQEYINKQRAKVALIAENVLKGQQNILLATRELISLLPETDIEEDDEDLKIFSLIESETDHLPLGAERSYWNEEALKNKEKEIQKSEQWAKEIGGMDACNNLFNRFKRYL